MSSVWSPLEGFRASHLTPLFDIYAHHGITPVLKRVNDFRVLSISYTSNPSHNPPSIKFPYCYQTFLPFLLLLVSHGILFLPKDRISLHAFNLSALYGIFLLILYLYLTLKQLKALSESFLFSPPMSTNMHALPFSLLFFVTSASPYPLCVPFSLLFPTNGHSLMSLVLSQIP